jgi:4-amino-4-deoxy-L-arabinose transferase-like glycosyltransferase
MFLDGLIYSTVSKNLAEGTGTFWNPLFTSTLMSDFHEHPPLAFGIQSLFFRLFGESRYVERIYSLVTVLSVAYIIIKIWRSLGYKHGWIPLLFWLTIPTVFWASYNNLLENTMTVFTSLSVFFYLRSHENRKILFVFLSGFMLTLGFLTKGFVAFFPLAFPFILWIFLRQKSFIKMVTGSLWLIVSALAPLLILILTHPVARLSLQKYFEWQVLNSIKNIVTVTSRFDIVNRMLSELAPVIVLCIVLIAYGWIRKHRTELLWINVRRGLIFISLGLAGVLPVMISMKQSGFYILPAYPFFALGFGIVIYPWIESLLTLVNFQAKGYSIFKWFTYGLFSAGIIAAIFYSGTYSRNEAEIKDSNIILSEIPEGTIININHELYENWGLHAYFYRFKKVSLDADLNSHRDYLLIKDEVMPDILNAQYAMESLKTSSYHLFKKKPVISAGSH